MNKLFIFFTSLFLLISTSAMATTSTQIDLAGGTIPAKGRFSVKLNPLVEGVRYNIQCSLNSPSDTIVHMSLKDNPVFSMVATSLNGQEIESITTGVNAKFKSGENTLVLKGLSVANTATSIEFINLDDEIAVNVARCIANPAL